ANFDGKAWSNPKHGGGSVCGHFINWHTIKDQPKSVLEDVMRIRTHPLVPRNIPIYDRARRCGAGSVHVVDVDPSVVLIGRISAVESRVVLHCYEPGETRGPAGTC